MPYVRGKGKCMSLSGTGTLLVVDSVHAQKNPLPFLSGKPRVSLPFPTERLLRSQVTEISIGIIV
ncbi:hypothetical protein I7I53_11219 [Histoplasma capsulatum var. duboisii H88]|uniref:Uncharacterized protein n=1 Tax=Ajellomyces capsulatus (strain H88) TaxID=544711 RepID=A0A8A1LCD1_AJEC8|nr:hypothetical protein I7I53_11219 [Histoplasma capsulatum var. duboisii H88]